ncbi:MAG TPA: HD domain-containing protein [Syntrophales bacterium]|nr:HD domain-containing protein [Syntrophales bacterium]
MKTLYVKDIKAGEKVKSSFLVMEKNLAYSQKGAPYLSVKLRDRTGDIEGRVWDNVAALDPLFRKGDIVSLQGRAVSYRDAIQLAVLDIRKMDETGIDPWDYFPSTKGDVEKMFAALEGFAATVENPWLRRLLEGFLRDEELAARLKRAPAAKGFHHAYLGGLLEHTLSMVKILDFLAGHYPAANRDMLIAGGILHDIGKIDEFTYERAIDYSTPGRLVGHILLGVEMLDRKIAAIEGFPADLALELKHIVLAHHGELDFGSPKRPKTVEALIVHYIDDLDAKVMAFQEFIGNSGAEDSEWTLYHRFFERFLYKGGQKA